MEKESKVRIVWAKMFCPYFGKAGVPKRETFSCLQCPAMGECWDLARKEWKRRGIELPKNV